MITTSVSDRTQTGCQYVSSNPDLHLCCWKCALTHIIKAFWMTPSQPFCLSHQCKTLQHYPVNRLRLSLMTDSWLLLYQILLSPKVMLHAVFQLTVNNCVIWVSYKWSHCTQELIRLFFFQFGFPFMNNLDNHTLHNGQGRHTCFDIK